jgi:signal transduction histidine kinase
MRSRRFADLAWVALVALAYFLPAQLGLEVARAAGQVRVAVWPAAGIALAVLRVLGYRVWPGIVIGAFLSQWTSNEPATTACGIACGSTLAALAGNWALTHIVDFDDALERFKDALGLLVFAAVFSALLGATIGTASVCASGIRPWTDAISLWEQWWLGDAMGDVVVTPLLLVWITSRRRQTWTGWKMAEALALSTVLFGVGWRSFAGLVTSRSTQHAYPVFPVVVWAALRFGPLGATMATFLFSVIGIIGAIFGFGPFEQATLSESLTVLQMFMAVVATTGLLLAAAMSERALAQELLRDSDRRKDEFMATLAHELRNPLSPISNATQLIRLKNATDPEIRELTEIIERQVHQMTRLVEDLLDISRITRGTLELRKELVELATVVHNAVETARPIIEAQSQDLCVTLPSQPIRLEGDPIRLSQVFSNLLNNSSKFTPPAGRIEVFATSRESAVVVTVRDNGVGIPAVELSRIFEIFAQVDHSGWKSHNGLGIGLALVKRLVEMHGGSIEVDSHGPGRGSEFRVHLPAILESPVQVR